MYWIIKQEETKSIGKPIFVNQTWSVLFVEMRKVCADAFVKQTTNTVHNNREAETKHVGFLSTEIEVTLLFRIKTSHMRHPIRL